MKEMKCLDCEKTFNGNTPKEVMDKMHPHYMSEHKDMILIIGAAVLIISYGMLIFQKFIYSH